MFCLHPRWFLTTLIAFALTASTAYSDEITYETVAFSGLDAPGLPGVNFAGFSYPSINGNGELVFETLLEGFGIDGSNNDAIFSSINNSLSLVAQKGDLPPGLVGDTVFSDFLPPLLDGLGNVAFEGTVLEPLGSTNEAIFSQATGSLDLIALQGEPVPGLISVYYQSFDRLTFGKNGHVVFFSDLAGAGVDATNATALLHQSPGQGVTVVARAGDEVPGLGGVFFQGSINNQVNGSGDVVFQMPFDIGGSGLFSWSSGVLETIVVTGDSAPGAPLGVNFGHFDGSHFDLNELGQVAFSAFLTTGKEALFSNASGDIELIAMGGETAPGIPLNPDFHSFRSTTINDNGETAFIADFEGQIAISDQAVYIERDGSLELVAHSGGVTPGTEAGVQFGVLFHLSFNNAGQLVFATLLQGNGINGGNNHAIFVYSDGELSLVAREGEMFDVDDDPAVEDLREIDDVFIANGTNVSWTTRSSLSEAGRIAMHLEFDDGSMGIFLAKVGVLLGDVNGDGLVNLLDVEPFVEALTSGAYVPEADANEDGVLDLLDVQPFVALLTGM